MGLEGELVVTVNRQGATFSFTVRNPDPVRVELSFSSQMIVDFVVSQDDRVVWRWSDSQRVDPAAVTESLTPGESFTVTRTWEQPPVGEYVCVAELRATNHTLVAEELFVV